MDVYIVLDVIEFGCGRLVDPRVIVWSDYYSSLEDAKTACQAVEMHLREECGLKEPEPEAWPWEPAESRQDCWELFSKETRRRYTILKVSQAPKAKTTADSLIQRLRRNPFSSFAP